MDQKDRTAVMEKARKKARENAQPTKVDPRTRVIAIGSGKGGVGLWLLQAISPPFPPTGHEGWNHQRRGRLERCA